jgi:hypothetical protein
MLDIIRKGKTGSASDLFIKERNVDAPFALTLNPFQGQVLLREGMKLISNPSR